MVRAQVTVSQQEEAIIATMALLIVQIEIKNKKFNRKSSHSLESLPKIKRNSNYQNSRISLSTE